MNFYALLLIASVACMSSRAHAQQAKQAEVAPSLKVLDSQEVDLGDYSIIYNRVETPVLKPESAQPIF